MNESPAYQLWLATNSWQRVLRRTLHPFGLTHVQYTVLASVSLLREEGVIATQTDVCRFGSLDPNMVSEVVGCLVNRGLLVRLDHPTDRRAKQLDLSEAGNGLLVEAKEAAKPVMIDFFAPLGNESKDLARMLGTIAAAHRHLADEESGPCLSTHEVENS